MAFLDELATNMSTHGVPIVLYSGNDDSLVAHRGTEGEFLSGPVLSVLIRLTDYDIVCCSSRNPGMSGAV